jgi:hypothetical protein
MAALTRDWNFAMQLLESILDPKHPVIVSTQVLPDYYGMSAVISAVGTAVGSLAPGQPALQARWEHSVSSEQLSAFQKKIFGLEDMVQLGEDLYSIVTDLKVTKKITLDQVWHAVHRAGGGLLNLSGIMAGGSGHMTFLEAQVVGSDPVFKLHDPMKGVQTYSKEEFLKFLETKEMVRILCSKVKV